MVEAIKISGIIISLNEEKHIERCIRSLQGVVDEIIVVDSFSTDKTQEICKELGVRLYLQEFLGYIEQKNFALDKATYPYVLALDADEALSEELRESVLEVKKGPIADGYLCNRLNNYCGKWIRHGGFYPDKKLRLWDKRKGRWGGRNPHDKVIVKGEVKLLKGDILHYPYERVSDHINQINKFSQIAARAAYQENKDFNPFIHIILNPPFKFFNKYILKGGFLDGYYGFIFCSLSAILNFLKYVQLYELRRRK